MHSKIIIDAFEKAGKELEELGDTSPSKVKKAEVLSDYLTNECKYTFGENRLRQYFNSCISGEEIELKQKVALGLCKYLGYKNYKDYVLKNKGKGGKMGNEMKPKIKIALFISVVIVLVFIINSSLNQKRWMVWQENHYVEVKFDDQKYDIGELKLYKEERIKKFKKITPDCNTSFFNTDGSVKIWYGKNKNKELEFFTSLGLHPETGKTLKAITSYMIEKYICKGY